MAIDFMVMPISRYLSGDYITPTMRYCWSLGVPYVIYGPNGKTEFPIDLPFGGTNSAERRSKIMDMILEDLAQLPPEAIGQIWDERSNDEPVYFRVNPESYQALQAVTTSTHLSAQIFFPTNFKLPFIMTTPIHTKIGSSEVALKELDQIKWSENCTEAVQTLRLALEESCRLTLPMIVDL